MAPIARYQKEWKPEDEAIRRRTHKGAGLMRCDNEIREWGLWEKNKTIPGRRREERFVLFTPRRGWGTT